MKRQTHRDGQNKKIGKIFDFSEEEQPHKERTIFDKVKNLSKKMRVATKEEEL